MEAKLDGYEEEHSEDRQIQISKSRKIERLKMEERRNHEPHGGAKKIWKQESEISDNEDLLINLNVNMTCFIYKNTIVYDAIIQK